MTRNYGPNWEEQREKRLEIDDHSCVSCGRGPEDEPRSIKLDETRLHVHHRLPVFVFEQNFDEIPWEVMNHTRNLLTMCETCHHVIEANEGYAKGADFKLTGDSRDRYHSRKPMGMSDNDFIDFLMDNAYHTNSSIDVETPETPFGTPIETIQRNLDIDELEDRIVTRLARETQADLQSFESQLEEIAKSASMAAEPTFGDEQVKQIINRIDDLQSQLPKDVKQELQ